MGLGDVYKRQSLALTDNQLGAITNCTVGLGAALLPGVSVLCTRTGVVTAEQYTNCLLYTSDAADERSSVDLGGRRIIKKKKKRKCRSDMNKMNKRQT